MMKRFSVLLLGFAACASFAATTNLPAYPANLPPRQVQVSRKTACNIDAKSVIVIAPNASQVTRFAAEELQTLLQGVLGAKLPIETALPPGQSAIVVGLNSWSEAAGIKQAQLAAVRDSFVIKTSGNKVYIAGTDDPATNIKNAIAKGGAWSFNFERGTLFGVYDFLERFAGARFYFPGELGTVLPGKRTISIPECSIFERPDFLIRKISNFWDGTYFEGANPDATINPAKNLNSLRLRLETTTIPCCHGLSRLNYLERFRNRPEYFVLMSNGKRHNDPAMSHPGQLCYTSGIREEIYQDAKTLLTGKGIEKRPGLEKSGLWRFRQYHKGYADIMPQDGFQPCQCANCKKAYTQGTHYASDLMWNLVVEIADRLKKENIPGQITMMGYRPYRSVPAVKIPDNVMVMVAESGPWYMLNAKQHQADNQEIRDWTKKLGRKVWLWNYANKFSTLVMPGIPSFTPRAIGKYYKEIAPWIFGAFVESESDRFMFMAMNHYLFSKIAWNNSVDPDSAVEEFYRLMFGKAAPEMKKILDEMEVIWTTQIAGRVVDTDLGPVGAPPSDYDLWNKVYSPEVIAKFEKQFKAAEKMVAGNSIEARRIQLFEREFLSFLKKAGEEYREKTNAVKGLHFNIGDKPEHSVSLVPFKSGNRETVPTQVSAWFDGDRLKVRFVCTEPRMAEVVAPTRKFDDQEIWRDNSIELFLNPSGDRKVYYQILVNSAGSISDLKIRKLGATGQQDWKWNSNAGVEVQNDAKSYTLTLSIPLKSLPDLKREAFPVNFARNRILNDSRKIETLYTWSPFIRGFHDLENFGTIGTSGKSMLINGDFAFEPAKWSARHWGLWDAKRNWITGWIGSNDLASNMRDDKVFFSAPACMKLVSTKDGACVTYYTVDKMQPGKRYRISYMLKLENVKPVKKGGGAVLNIWDDANRWFPKNNWLTGTMDWTRQSFDFTSGKNTNAGKNKARISLRLLNATGTAWFDDVRLEELP